MWRIIFIQNIAIIAFVIFLTGCSSVRPITYPLSEPYTKISQKKTPINVQVAVFSDKRPKEEKLSRDREKNVRSDADGYTNDEDFKGKVSEGISKMLVDHLSFSKVFNNISMASFTSADISNSRLDSLRKSGVDALLLGEINHFYGRCPANTARMVTIVTAVTVPFVVFGTVAFGPFTCIMAIPAGTCVFALMSMHPKDFEYSTQLTLKMICTSTYNVIWEDSFATSAQRSGTEEWMEKVDGAIYSLHDVGNKIVENLSKSEIKLNQ